MLNGIYKRAQEISIHALRMERDSEAFRFPVFYRKFQSTRSAWSATSFFFIWPSLSGISIHALRMERDFS